ncbi:hypothetical protein COZ82_03715 [Candidatus Kaiserbacteria bacterium CG_4_8_14_3_um_filter_38_9]|uniref:Septum formation initiator n=1 Tax=Candidatus Kaiserbacteria bacterium CG_4_8_14_3_um_filter_38_9 TaxID=1974599 RepID=A0A2M7IMY1_9BACT|nr:MAG: hypothetical protein COZ82_03715 [Candidatus Kaiserbacteria bacterium CG_4_8_14_3_um_filter_38_9]
MLNFYQKRSWRTVLYSPITLTFLMMISLYLAYVTYNRYVIEREMSSRQLDAENELKTLEQRRDTLQKKVDYLSNDRGIEAEMRRNFDVAREGEKVVIILDDEIATNNIEPLSSITPTTTRPWYKFWQ